MTTHHQTFTCGILTFTLLSNFSPDMTFSLVEDSLRAGCKSGEEVAEFINKKQGEEKVWVAENGK